MFSPKFKFLGLIAFLDRGTYTSPISQSLLLVEGVAPTSVAFLPGSPMCKLNSLYLPAGERLLLCRGFHSVCPSDTVPFCRAEGSSLWPSRSKGSSEDRTVMWKGKGETSSAAAIVTKCICGLKVSTVINKSMCGLKPLTSHPAKAQYKK